MVDPIRFLRGTAAQNNALTKEDGVLTVDTTNKTIRVHDGSTAGGSRLATHLELVNGLGDKADSADVGVANGIAELDSNGKVPLVQINDALIGQVDYQGVWNANTNTPTLPDPTTVKGHYYVTNVAGTYSSTDFEVGDWVISNGTVWDKVDNTDAVSSVAGKTGVVTLVKADVGLGNVDNTSDANKPVSTAQQTALDLKANLSGGNTFSGNQTISGTVIMTAGVFSHRTTTDLDVAGSAYYSFQDNSTGSFVERGWMGFGAGDGDIDITNNTDGKVHLRTATGRILTASSDGVGIFASTVTALAAQIKTLQINGGDNNTTGGIRLRSANASVDTAYYATNNGLHVATLTNHPVLIDVNNVEVVKFESGAMRFQNTGAVLWMAPTAGSAGMYTSGSDLILFNGSGAEDRVTITTTGAAYFGNTIVTRGNMNVSPLSANTDAQIALVPTGTGASYLSYGSFLRFSNDIWFNSAGHVGIGGNPSVLGSHKTLHVVGSSNAYAGALRLNSADYSVGIYLYGDDGSTKFGNAHNLPFTFINNNSEYMRAFGNGNVHVAGTSDTGEKFAVNGAILATGTASGWSAAGVYLDYTSGISRITAGSNGGNNRDLALRANAAGTPNSQQVYLRYDGNVGFSNNDPQHIVDINDDTIRVRTAKTPASASATGNQGQISWDANYVYVCTATNTWKRAALATW